jgi:hypothetical protein
VVDPNGKVLYQQGTGGSTITVDSVEKLNIVDAEGKSLFSRTKVLGFYI